MKERYYIDLAQYSIQKLKASLQKREMIPSRVILKEHIEERFGILQAHGIHNVVSDINFSLELAKELETL